MNVRFSLLSGYYSIVGYIDLCLVLFSISRLCISRIHIFCLSYLMDIILLLDVSNYGMLYAPNIGSVIGAIIFFILSYLLADYIVGFLTSVEEGLIKIPVVDLFLGTIGLIVGLLVAYLI